MGKRKLITQIEKIIYAFILGVVPFINFSKGIDFCDSGYSIMLFSNCNTHFGNWMLSTYLSNLFGSVLLKLPYGNTYLGLKAYCLIIVAIMAVCLYFYLSRMLHYRAVFMGMLIALFARWCPGVVLYNYLSYFLFYGAILFILTWCEKKKEIYLIFSGILLGLNVFVRISNITQVILIIPVVLAGLICHEKAGKILILFLKCLAGFFVGESVPVLSILIKYGLKPYFRMLQSLFTMSDRQDSYSGLAMLNAYPEMIMKYRLWLFLLLIILAAGIGVSFFCKRKWNKVLLIIGILGALAFWMRLAHYWSVFTIHDYTSFLSIEFGLVVAICISVIISLYVLFFKKAAIEDRCIAAITLCVIFVAPLGTNTGFLATINNLYFIMPVTVGLLWKYVFRNKSRFLLPVKTVAPVLAAFIILQTFLFSITYVYGDVNAKQLDCKITKNRALKNIQVLEGMAPMIEDVSEYVSRNNLTGKSCITFGNIPIMDFALDMPTAISTSWPDLNSYTIENFERELGEIPESEQPVIILNKWYFADKDIFNKDLQDNLPKTKILADYMVENQYELIYENDKFLIYEN